MISRSAPLIVGSDDAARNVIIFHGYTSSPDELRSLAEALALKLDAQVHVPLLPGHGTREEDLLPYRYPDFLAFARSVTARISDDGKPLMFIGHSFGAYLAIEMAATYKTEAIVLTVATFLLRFPYSLPGTATLMSMRTLWDKRLTVQDKMSRAGLFFYEYMPGFALALLHEGIERSKRLLRQVTCPILTIHTQQDPLTPPSSGSVILEHSGKHKHNTRIVLENREHGIFYGDGSDEVVEHIATFLEKQIRK